MALPDYLQKQSNLYKLNKARAASIDKVAWLPDDPVAWIEREFYIPETNAPIVLEPYHRDVIREALRREDGLLAYSTMMWSDRKKSAKSTIAGAVVLFMAHHHPWETCRVVGNDLKQANSRTFYYITRAIELNPRLRPVCSVKLYTIKLPNHTTIEAVPVDPKGEAGGGDLIVCFTELWAAKNHAALQMWSETTLSPLKYGKSLRWCESYAGYVGESPILEQLYETGVQQGKQINGAPEIYVNEPARLLTMWNTSTRCQWQTDDYYAQEAAILTPQEFERLHRNQWAMASNPFVPIEWWDQCHVDEMPPLSKHQPVVVGIDAAVSNDTFAIVVVSRTGDVCHVRYANVWKPPVGGTINFAEPEAELRRIARDYNVVEYALDSFQLYDMMSRLNREGVGFFRSFSQAGDRLIADKALYDRIRDRRIQHSGEHTLREHIANASAKAEGDKLRIIKKAESAKIDAAVALSMACQRASYLNIG